MIRRSYDGFLRQERDELRKRVKSLDDRLASANSLNEQQATEMSSMREKVSALTAAAVEAEATRKKQVQVASTVGDQAGESLRHDQAARAVAQAGFFNTTTAAETDVRFSQVQDSLISARIALSKSPVKAAAEDDERNASASAVGSSAGARESAVLVSTAEPTPSNRHALPDDVDDESVEDVVYRESDDYEDEDEEEELDEEDEEEPEEEEEDEEGDEENAADYEENDRVGAKALAGQDAKARLGMRTYTEEANDEDDDDDDEAEDDDDIEYDDDDEDEEEQESERNVTTTTPKAPPTIEQDEEEGSDSSDIVALN